jgi:hypothetical protein
MTVKQKDELKKLVKNRIERAQPKYNEKREEARKLVVGRMKLEAGVPALVASIAMARKHVEDLEAELVLKGFVEESSYNYRSGTTTRVVSLKNFHKNEILQEGIDAIVKHIDFDQLYEDLMVEVWLADDVEKVMEVLKRIDV